MTEFANIELSLITSSLTNYLQGDVQALLERRAPGSQVQYVEDEQPRAITDRASVVGPQQGGTA